MKILVVKDYYDMSRLAAQAVAEVVTGTEKPVLGLATGSTPVGTYKLLVEMCKTGKLSFRNVTTVNLDEYVGLGKRDEQSYVHFMHENFFDRTDIPERNTNLPNGLAKDLDKECARYHDLLGEYRQDLQILGLGSNGHIGFNEPNTSFESTTHVVDLSQSTIRDNARFFPHPSCVPTRAITMGIAEIMNSKKILVLANGANKADAVYQMVYGEIKENCPASVLQRHPECTLIVDETAGARLLNVK
ncbi:MAG: glucosamine-6-phosphate deaminase [Corallococcus sp.]|nr:glucosamine-6-phosphate deaminase [Corallococcus sp.]MCM1359776.1 glucosamine-6-phosphate deaminase [Corallococcus sp.]MCM1395698.1 glucosamine-6-phosphate deaminase [Corallococcus sp.]